MPLCLNVTCSYLCDLFLRLSSCLHRKSSWARNLMRQRGSIQKFRSHKIQFLAPAGAEIYRAPRGALSGGGFLAPSVVDLKMLYKCITPPHLESSISPIKSISLWNVDIHLVLEENLKTIRTDGAPALSLSLLEPERLKEPLRMPYSRLNEWSVVDNRRTCLPNVVS